MECTERPAAPRTTLGRPKLLSLFAAFLALPLLVSLVGCPSEDAARSTTTPGRKPAAVTAPALAAKPPVAGAPNAACSRPPARRPTDVASLPHGTSCVLDELSAALVVPVASGAVELAFEHPPSATREERESRQVRNPSRALPMARTSQRGALRSTLKGCGTPIFQGDPFDHRKRGLQDPTGLKDSFVLG